MDIRHNALQQPAEILLKEIDLENHIRTQLDETQIYFDYNLVPDTETSSLIINVLYSFTIHN